MVLITGGAYQHKLDFIYKNFKLCENDICFTGSGLNWNNKKVIYKFNDIVKKWFDDGLNPEEHILNVLDGLKDKIIVIDQTGCGVVPFDEKERLLREITGRTCCILAQAADEVYNVIFGLGVKIKG